MFKFFTEYLFPENSIALGIVIFLISFFCIWVVGLIIYWIWLIKKRKQIENNQNIQALVDALQGRDLGREDSDPNINAEAVFHEYCEKQDLSKSSSITKHLRKIIPLKTDFSITKHIKTVFLAGWDESRLEVSELINHTTNNLFRWNGLFRSILAVFIVIGLLGTLFGLTDSLTDLSPALKGSAAIETPTENSERMTQALGNLMDNIKGAFAPSILGIFFTVLGVIFYGFYLQFACHPIKSDLERLTLTVWVPQLYPTTSQKFIQTLQKSESQMQKGFETAAQFSESVKKVHGNIDEFNESLTQVRAITQPLSDSVTQINKAASDISNAADVLNTGFTESLDKFSRDFASSVNNLTGFQDEIRNLHQQFQDAANHRLDQQTQKLDEQNQNLITSLEVFKNNERLYVDSCQQIDETLQQFLNKTNEANANIETSNREFLDGINTSNREWISEIQDQLKSELAIIQPTLKKELESLTNQLTSDLNEVQGTLDERLKALTDQLNFFQLPIEKTADQIEGTIESFTRIMEGIVNDLQSEFQKQNETITEQNEKYGEQLTSVKNLNERVENLLTQLDESSKNQKEAVDTLSSNVGGLTDNINNLDSAINNFTSDSGDLSQSVGAIRGDIEKLGTASQQFVEKVDKADVTPLTASIEKLNTSINAISQHSHSLADAVDRLARQEGSLGSGQKTKRPFFKIILNPLSWRWPFKKNTSETKNKNEEK